MDSPLFRPAALAASACTAVQAGVWFVLSLMALLTSVEVLGPTTKEDADKYQSVTGVFNLAMISCYFPRSIYSTCCTDIILRGNPLMGISIVYVLGSLVWICSSTLLLLDMMNKEKNAVKLTLTWAGVTWSISLLDFVVAILFGIDYHNIVTTCEVAYGSLYASVAGMLMSLSARGYILWALNVVAASLLFRAAIKEASAEGRSRRYSGSSSSSVYHSPADALQDSRSMVFQAQAQMGQPWVTPGTTPRSRPASPPAPYAPLAAWGGAPADGGRLSQPPRGAPPPAPAHAPAHSGYGHAQVQRGGLAARMAQGPSSQFGSQRGPGPAPPQPQPQPQPQPPTSSQRLPRAAAIPAPDYDAGNAPRRSVLKKPAPAADAWRQPAPQQSGRGWASQQPQQPLSPDGSGGWGPSASGRWGGYDNRAWQDGGGGGGGGGDDRWARTGF